MLVAGSLFLHKYFRTPGLPRGKDLLSGVSIVPISEYKTGLNRAGSCIHRSFLNSCIQLLFLFCIERRPVYLMPGINNAGKEDNFSNPCTPARSCANKKLLQ